MKLMILGYGGHGKDEVCHTLARLYDLPWQSSSMAAADKVVWPALRHITGYQSPQQCMDDRRNHRTLWYELIKLYNHHDKARLAREVYEDSDIYCGMRDADELEATRAEGLCDYVVWVHAFHRVPDEDRSSCTVTPDMADYVLDNSGPKADLTQEVTRMMDDLLGRLHHG